MTTAPLRSLAHIFDQLGGALLEPLTDSVTRNRAVDGIVIWDPADDPAITRHAIVLGVGVHGEDKIRELLGELERREASALVVRTPVEISNDIRRVAQRTGVTLVGLVEGATWAQAAAMLRTVLAEDDISAMVPELLGGIPSGDLFSLANAIAALLDAPVTIEDRHSNVLAFSGRQDEADAMRIATVLGRRVPDRYINAQELRGKFDQIYRSVEPVSVPPWSLNGEQSLPRVAVAVRAADEILGSIWAVVKAPLSAERTQAFGDAAKLVALHMLKLRAGSNVERRLRADLLSTVLEGGPSAMEAAARLGIVGQPAIVLGLGVLPPLSSDRDFAWSAAQEAVLQRTADAFSLHLTALQPGSAVAVLGNAAYGIVPVHGDGGDAGRYAARVAEAFLRRIGPDTRAVIGIGSLARETSALGASCRAADRALRVLRHDAGLRRLATAEDVHVDSLLLEIADLAVARGDTVTPPIARLLAFDAEHEAQLAATLRCWLDAFGNVQAAAHSAYVHPNTFRYRLRRAAEVSGLDLNDPRERFAAMLQLRLLDLNGGVTPTH